MAPPPQIIQWIRRAYPRPRVDDVWLNDCCEWIRNELNIDPVASKDEFIRNVENQLLESNLCDSMVADTGLPQNAPTMNNERLRDQPVLVEIIAIDEIGHSAFNLQNTRQVRMEREDLAGLAVQEGVEDDEGPIPNYPHTMLKLHVSDGNVTLPAIEYRNIPDFKLGETPLGYKMLLKDVLIRRGLVFLEPGKIELKGYETPDRDERRDKDFVRGLCVRLGKPPPPEDEEQGDENQADVEQENLPQAPPRTPEVAIRSPLREIPEPLEPELDHMQVDEDVDLPRKRRVPRLVNGASGPFGPSPSTAASSTLVSSRFFAGSERPTAPSTTSEMTQTLARILSPVRGPTIDIEDDEDEDVPTRNALNASSRTEASRATQRSAQANRSVRADVSFEEFDFPSDDALDAAFLDEIAKVEEAALGNDQESRSRASSSAPSTKPPAGSSSIVSAATRSSSNTRPQPRPRPVPTQTRAQARPSPVPVNIINIDDDDEDDKENVPVPQRRVRRRVVDGVIDLSD